jgi:hypothetical protein
VLCGPSQCGKSTFADHLADVFTVVNAGRIRQRLGLSFGRSRAEEAVWRSFEREKRAALRRRQNVVLDACHLSPEARRLFTALARWSQTSGVRLIYALSCCYAEPDHHAVMRRENARFLLEVNEFMPVLADPALGVDPVRTHFADTPWHLVAEAARQRTDFLAGQLKAQAFWTREALAPHPAGGSPEATGPGAPGATLRD